MRTCSGAAPAERLVALLEPASAVPWHSDKQTQALFEAMSPAHQEQVMAMALGGMTVACAVDSYPCIESGKRVQRADVRFGGKVGGLRTAKNAGKRQTVLVIANGGVASRWLSSREIARIEATNR